jgi:hypothetical protein
MREIELVSERLREVLGEVKSESEIEIWTGHGVLLEGTKMTFRAEGAIGEIQSETGRTKMEERVLWKGMNEPRA